MSNRVVLSAEDEAMLSYLALRDVENLLDLVIEESERELKGRERHRDIDLAAALDRAVSRATAGHANSDTHELVRSMAAQKLGSSYTDIFDHKFTKYISFGRIADQIFDGWREMRRPGDRGSIVKAYATAVAGAGAATAFISAIPGLVVAAAAAYGALTVFPKWAIHKWKNHKTFDAIDELKNIRDGVRSELRHLEAMHRKPTGLQIARSADTGVVHLIRWQGGKRHCDRFPAHIEMQPNGEISKEAWLRGGKTIVSMDRVLGGQEVDLDYATYQARRMWVQELDLHRKERIETFLDLAAEKAPAIDLSKPLAALAASNPDWIDELEEGFDVRMTG